LKEKIRNQKWMRKNHSRVSSHEPPCDFLVWRKPYLWLKKEYYYNLTQKHILNLIDSRWHFCEYFKTSHIIRFSAKFWCRELPRKVVVFNFINWVHCRKKVCHVMTPTYLFPTWETCTAKKNCFCNLQAWQNFQDL